MVQPPTSNRITERMRGDVIRTYSQQQQHEHEQSKGGRILTTTKYSVCTIRTTVFYMLINFHMLRTTGDSGSTSPTPSVSMIMIMITITYDR